MGRTVVVKGRKSHSWIVINSGDLKIVPDRINYYLCVLTCLILILVSTSSAAGCTPSYHGENLIPEKPTGDILISEGKSFRMACRLRRHNSVKWTLDGKEIVGEFGRLLNVIMMTNDTHGEDIHTEIHVSKSTKKHSGEYKCVSVCHDESRRRNEFANNGARLQVIFGEAPTVDGTPLTEVSLDGNEDIVRDLVRFTVLGKKHEVIKCNGTNIKSIKWRKGEKDALREDDIGPCSAKEKSPRRGESDEEFWLKEDAPCVEEVEEETLDDGHTKAKNKRLNLVFSFVRKEYLGPYTCVTVPQDSSSDLGFKTTIYLKETFGIKRIVPGSLTRSFEKGHRSITVVAGNTLSIYCNVTANVSESSYRVRWEKDGQDLNISEGNKGGEYKYHNKTWFDYETAEAKHRGVYRCTATYENKDYTFEFYVRVKDKLVPLWPFLGICLEVAVLCVIIVVYEKRRNKTELEESDTDGSPDQ